MIALADIPVQPATHGPTCACRVCHSTGYAKLLERADWQTQELARQADEISMLRRQLAVEQYKRLVAETHLAVARGDRQAWAAAVAGKDGCGISAADRDTIERSLSRVCRECGAPYHGSIDADCAACGERLAVSCADCGRDFAHEELTCGRCEDCTESFSRAIRRDRADAIRRDRADAIRESHGDYLRDQQKGA